MACRSRVVVLHDSVPAGARPDQLDSLHQVRSVTQVLRDQGHHVFTLPWGSDPMSTRAKLRRLAPGQVFNLVESVGGDVSLNHLPPAWLECWGLAYTGCSARAHRVTTNKILAKELLVACGIPTPPWCTAQGFLDAPQVIIKPVTEDASVGIDEASVIENPGSAGLHTLLEERCRTSGREFFAEAYVDGREFNLGLVGNQDSPELLRPGEVVFVGYEERRKTKVVGYSAKWLPDSYEYEHTWPRYVFADSDSRLLTMLSDLARRCWRDFALAGYGRVDCRVDRQGQPWVLEVNPNPCLSRDAGLAGAAEAHGWTYQELIARILAAARRGPIRRPVRLVG